MSALKRLDRQLEEATAALQVVQSIYDVKAEARKWVSCTISSAAKHRPRRLLTISARTPHLPIIVWRRMQFCILMGIDLARCLFATRKTTRALSWGFVRFIPACDTHANLMSEQLNESGWRLIALSIPHFLLHAQPGTAQRPLFLSMIPVPLPGTSPSHPSNVGPTSSWSWSARPRHTNGTTSFSF